jgi:transcriptional regulator with XRE-family HTH domain
MEDVVPLTVLTEWREREGLNKAQAAKRVGVPRATWLRWETGVRRPGKDKLPKLEQETGIPTRVLRPDLAELLSGAAA